MSKPEPKDRKQAAAFRKAAREVGADEASEQEFQDALRKVANHKPDRYYDEIRAKRAEAQEQLTALQSGELWIGHPSEHRTEAKICDLQRQIGEYDTILNRAPTR